MTEKDTCEIYCFDEEKVTRLQNEINKVNFYETVKIFKVLADETRLKIAFSLCQEEELCVCDAANIVGSSVATASHHLRTLRNMGIAKYRKEGKLIFYSLVDENIKKLIDQAVSQEKGVITNG